MTGFTSKRQAAMDKLVEIQEELGMYDDQKPVQELVAFYNPQHGGFYWAKPTTISAPWLPLPRRNIEKEDYERPA